MIPLRSTIVSLLLFVALPCFAYSPSPTLRLKDGGTIVGAWADSAGSDMLRWKGTAFASPFEFDLERLDSVEFPGKDQPPAPKGDDGFELAGGDVLFGRLVGLDDEAATIEVPRLGRLKIRRAGLARIDRRRDGGGLIYLGPNGLLGWREPGGPADRSWRDESGRMVTHTTGAAILGDVDLPTRAAVEFVVSWSRTPNFAISLGVDDTPETAAHAFRLDVWDGDLIARRETANESDLATVAPLAKTAGRVHMIAYLDQDRGRLIVTTTSGRTLADIRMANPGDRTRGSIRLENLGGDLTLERLRVSRWDGSPPREATADRSRIHRADGSIVYGKVARHDDAAKAFVVVEGGTESRIPDADVASVYLSSPIDGPSRSVRVTLADGGRIGGELAAVEGGVVALTVPGIDGPVRIPAEALRSLAVPGRETTPPRDFARPGRLDVEGANLHGYFADGSDAPGSTCLVWHPTASRNAAALKPGITGRVVFKEPPAPPPSITGDPEQDAQIRAVQARNAILQQRGLLPQPAPVAVAAPRGAAVVERVRVVGPDGKPIVMAPGVVVKVEVNGQGVMIAQPMPAPVRPEVNVREMDAKDRPPAPPAPRPAPVGGGQAPGAAPAAPQFVFRQIRPQPSQPTQPVPTQRKLPPAVYLRTGDVIPAEVTKIDEKGVTFKTTTSPSTTVAHDKIKAVVLAESPSIPIAKSKRDRLLTLPRMQKASPPTHLIRSTDGDYLRGRVVGLDGESLVVEVRLERKEIARKHVARIIWLQPDELDPSKAPAPVAGTPGPPRVQALRDDGTRVTFLAERLDGAILSGRSDVLGPCRVAIADIDQLLIGGTIEREAVGLAFGQWRLSNAPEPKSASADAGGSGTESALVGKPAPDFALAMLDGRPFRLSERRGNVVVLDFWATWCGPCVQSMPLVDAAVREFHDRGVNLVAVNLQETPKEIQAMLARHKLDISVALDRDGVVAQQYGATAIPQTVVIAPDGTVSRVFIGGGPRLADSLRDAIRPLLPPEAPKEEAK